MLQELERGFCTPGTALGAMATTMDRACHGPGLGVSTAVQTDDSHRSEVTEAGERVVK